MKSWLTHVLIGGLLLTACQAKDNLMEKNNSDLQFEKIVLFFYIACVTRKPQVNLERLMII